MENYFHDNHRCSETKQEMYERNIEARSRNHCCRGKAVRVAYSECVSTALVIQHTKRMRLSILSHVACLALPCFNTVSHRKA